MRIDVTELRRFYTSPLGKVARRMLIRRLSALWPQARGLDMLGLGYAAPLLGPYVAEARSVIAAMPAAQGVECWPLDGLMRSVLCLEGETPFRDSQFDRVIVAHVLEETEALSAMLAEVRRITAPAGRVMVIVANRRGIWAQVESTPFGHGRSFSRTQLNVALRRADLEPVAWARAVYAPPWQLGPLLRAARSFERVGERVAPRFGGVLMVEAVKHVVRPVRGTRALNPAFRPSLAGVTARQRPAAMRDRTDGADPGAPGCGVLKRRA